MSREGEGLGMTPISKPSSGQIAHFIEKNSVHGPVHSPGFVVSPYLEAVHNSTYLETLYAGSGGGMHYPYTSTTSSSGLLDQLNHAHSHLQLTNNYQWFYSGIQSFHPNP